MQGFYVPVDYHAYPGDTTASSGAFVSAWQTAYCRTLVQEDTRSAHAPCRASMCWWTTMRILENHGLFRHSRTRLSDGLL